MDSGVLVQLRSHLNGWLTEMIRYLEQITCILARVIGLELVLLCIVLPAGAQVGTLTPFPNKVLGNRIISVVPSSSTSGAVDIRVTTTGLVASSIRADIVDGIVAV